MNYFSVVKFKKLKQLHESSTELLSISALCGRTRICKELNNQIGSPFLFRYLVFYLIKHNHANCSFLPLSLSLHIYPHFIFSESSFENISRVHLI